jgi:hypothetical protein
MYIEFVNQDTKYYRSQHKNLHPLQMKCHGTKDTERLGRLNPVGG